MTTLSTAPTVDLPRAACRLFRGPRGPVPYVALWSSEEILDAPVIETARGIGYADETSIDRDRQGVLWTRVTARPGVGEPFYQRLHPVRQRRAMRRLLCQVCAGPADQNERGALWLIDASEGRWSGWPEGAQCAQPPLCLRCARFSVKACPALRAGCVVVRARSFVSGASGGLYRTGREPQSRPLLVGASTVMHEDSRIRWMQADQLVRELVNTTPVSL